MILAVEAAGGLVQGLLLGVAQGHLLEVADCGRWGPERASGSCPDAYSAQPSLLYLLLEQIAGFLVLARLEILVHAALRFMASSKSTWWPSKSGPSTQANLVSPPTVRRQPPHMPVPSIMMGLMDDGGVACRSASVVLQTNFIMTMGPMAKTSSYWLPSSMQLLQGLGDQALLAVGAVVGA